MFSVPKDVQKEAEISLQLHHVGYEGGTATGFSRARQLIRGKVDIVTLRTMRNWFARHIVTSYPGYKKWVADGSPTKLVPGKTHSYRGAVAWELWGGTPAYKWIQSPRIQAALDKAYPDKNNTLYGNLKI